jgi:imidazole glycerol-phosphate synthase subunit HisF
LHNFRLIARLDIKGPNLIKGVHLEGLRKIGNPNEFALKYYLEGADELIFMDCVASLYGRNNLFEIIRQATKNIFIPITVGGGIKSIEDVTEVLRSGADKVAINTAAVNNPKLLTDIANKFGSQALVLSIEAKEISDNRWEAFTQNGREPSGLEVLEWAQEATKLGVGEILLTSIDKEGTRKGFDLRLLKHFSNKIEVPIIASGGMGKLEDLNPIHVQGLADAVAIADFLHYNRSNLNLIREYAQDLKMNVRFYEFT